MALQRLSQRTSSRNISKPNADKALKRIEAELRVLIDKSPLCEFHLNRAQRLRNDVTFTLDNIRSLYGKLP